MSCNKEKLLDDLKKQLEKDKVPAAKITDLLTKAKNMLKTADKPSKKEMDDAPSSAKEMLATAGGGGSGGGVGAPGSPTSAGGSIAPGTIKAAGEKVIVAGAVGAAAAAAGAGGMHGGNQAAQDADLALADAHDVQDAETDFGWTSMIHPDPLYTTLVPLLDAKYTMKEDYPTSRGDIDENKNFWKQNYTTGEWWDCHHTGYLRKVDGAGNYETKVPGTKLDYTIGDEGKVNASNVDNLILENKYTHVILDHTEIIDGDVYNNYNMNVFENILLTQIELIGLVRVVTIGVSDTLLIGAHYRVLCGGPIDIDGSIINLN